MDESAKLPFGRDKILTNVVTVPAAAPEVTVPLYVDKKSSMKDMATLLEHPEILEQLTRVAVHGNTNYDYKFNVVERATFANICATGNIEVAGVLCNFPRVESTQLPLLRNLAWELATITPAQLKIIVGCASNIKPETTAKICEEWTTNGLCNGWAEMKGHDIAKLILADDGKLLSEKSATFGGLNDIQMFHVVNALVAHEKPKVVDSYYDRRYLPLQLVPTYLKAIGMSNVVALGARRDGADGRTLDAVDSKTLEKWGSTDAATDLAKLKEMFYLKRAWRVDFIQGDNYTLDVNHIPDGVLMATTLIVK